MISSQRDPKLKSKLKELVAERERITGYRIRQTDIAAATGLNPNTISRWMSPEPFDRLEAKALTRLCTWLNCDVGTLLYIDNGHTENHGN